MKLKKINLMKATKCEGRYSDHPDISLKKWYLVKFRGRYAAGQFSRVWHGLNFDAIYDAGVQFDMPGTNSSGWEGCWEIQK